MWSCKLYGSFVVVGTWFCFIFEYINLQALISKCFVFNQVMTMPRKTRSWRKRIKRKMMTSPVRKMVKFLVYQKTESVFSLSTCWFKLSLLNLFSSTDGSESGRQVKTVQERWRESLLACSSLSQVFLHLSTLERSVVWAKSILNARCKVCRRKGDAENMLLCDACDRGYHIFCVRPKLKVRTKL